MDISREKPLETMAAADSADGGNQTKKVFTLIVGAGGALTMAEILRPKPNRCPDCWGNRIKISLDMEKALDGIPPFSITVCETCGGTGVV